MTTNKILLATLLVGNITYVYADNSDVEKFQSDLETLKTNYEIKLDTLEQQLELLQSQANNNNEATQQLAVKVSQQGNRTAANTFNPAIGVILDGKYQQMPTDYEFLLPGFFLGEESGPGESGLSMGESELNLSANIDDKFYGHITIAFGDETEVEEAFIQTIALPFNTTVKFGRFLSGVGYLNSKHSHTDDFANRPLAYQAFLANGFKDDGVQLRWLAPTTLFWESGIELYRGESFPITGAEHNGKGAASIFTHIGGDINFSHSWQLGLSLLKGKVADRSNEEDEIFSGDSDLLIADFIWKWAPNGNNKLNNAKIQAEYFRRNEEGDFTDNKAFTQRINADQSGWYVQGVYQFIPRWRVGVRYEKLQADDLPATFNDSVMDNLDHNPQQLSLMLDWSNSEFSRIRLQYSLDETSPDKSNIWILQYTVAFGAHGAHAF